MIAAARGPPIPYPKESRCRPKTSLAMKLASEPST